MKVLIAGAGPTGLVLALNLARRSVPFRLIHSGAGPGEHSRAMVVQARTLEFYRQFGFADRMIAEGIVLPKAHLRESGSDGRPHEILQLNFSDLGTGISPYPFAFSYPQDDHERFLAGRLVDAGGAIEWNTTLRNFTQSDGAVEATIEGPGGVERVTADYICGCDGAHSTVRETLGLGFPGLTYDQLFFVCDAKVAPDLREEVYVTLGPYALILMFPVRSSGMHRLIGLIPPGYTDADAISFEQIRDRVELLLNIRVKEVNWFAAYRVHHRVAERFRDGRAFILGDAAHIHSPAGGQGMNTGIGDAMNLGWKLADVVRGRADERILDTYEAERIGFARALVATTDRAFTAMIAPGVPGALIRRVAAPAIIWTATRFAAVRHQLFRIVSQTQVEYRGSPLSEGEAGGVRGGDRLPWVQSLDNYAPLQSLDWQVHVYGNPPAELAPCCERMGIPINVFAWNADVKRAGFARDAAYLLRPDGYVAAAFEHDAASGMKAYVEGRGAPRRPGLPNG